MVKIFIPAKSFLTWGGGVDFLSYYISILNEISTIQTTVGLPAEHIDRKIFKWAKNSLKRLAGKAVTPPKTYNLGGSVASTYPNINIISYRPHSIPTELKGADFVFLAMRPMAEIERKKVIGYIPDLQHIHLPQFFTAKERTNRDKLFKNILKHSQTIFVNSKDTALDIKKSYPTEAAMCNFFSMSFLPTAHNFLFEEAHLSKYNLPKRYFIISSQLWLHKDHPTAIKAMAALIKEERYADVELLCSGSTQDYRNPNYFSEIKELIASLKLEKNVRFLGFIPKLEQLAILRGAVAVVQPTLFEGGPGGGATYEAVAYGVPAIISDIEINKEAIAPQIALFKKGDSIDLASKMAYALTNPAPKHTIEELKAQSAKNFAQAKLDIENFILGLSKN